MLKFLNIRIDSQLNVNGEILKGSIFQHYIWYGTIPNSMILKIKK